MSHISITGPVRGSHLAMDISVEYSWGYVHHANMAVLSLTPDVLSTWKGLVHDFTISLLIKPLGLFINKTFKISSARVLVLGRFKLVKMIHIFFFFSRIHCTYKSVPTPVFTCAVVLQDLSLLRMHFPEVILQNTAFKILLLQTVFVFI